MLTHHEPAHPTSVGVATACAIIGAATTRLDAIRAEAERELIEHVRSRHDLEALIERLIGRLDEADAVDADLEDFDEDCDRLIERGESDGLEHAELDDGEHDLSTQPETYGRGWDDRAWRASLDERLFSDLPSGVRRAARQISMRRRSGS